jgi:hypothetical protein
MRAFVGVMAVAALGFGAGPFAYRTAMSYLNGTASVSGYDEHVFGEVASAIAHRPVHVACRDWTAWHLAAWQFADGALKGYVEFRNGKPTDRALLAPEVCRTLAGLSGGARLPSLECAKIAVSFCGTAVNRLALAVTALAHESYHLAGNIDEATTQCYGLQTTTFVAVRLGAPPAYARELGTYALARWMTPDQGPYYTPLCHRGGPLDLHRADFTWPS